MNNETMMKAVAAMLVAYDNATGAAGADAVIADPAKWAADKNAAAYLPMYHHAAQLLAEIQSRIDNTGKPAGTVAALKRIAKGTMERRPIYHGIFRQDGKWCIVDGYRAVRLNEDVPSVPHAPDDAESAAARMDVSKCIPDISGGKPVDLPTIADLKTWIAAEKAKHGNSWQKHPYTLHAGDMEIGANPQYLIDMLQALPGCSAVATSPISPIYFSAESGDGILCPCRLRKKEEKAA